VTKVSIKAKIWWDVSIKAYRLQCDFKPQLVDFLKKNIPVSDRTYDPQTKIWTFTEQYLDGVKKLMDLLYGQNNIAILSKAQVESSTGQNYNNKPSVGTRTSIDVDLTEFMKLLPFDIAQTAYRKACLIFHPDRGGDMEKMSKLNALWTRIEKEVYNQ
jgi:hypothetical protein